MALTTLLNVKSNLSVDSNADDVLLTRTINQVSTAILNYLQRPLLARTTYTEVRSGVGNQKITLRNWPVVSIASVTINGVNIPQGTNPTKPGWFLQQWDGAVAGNLQQLYLIGYCFSRGLNNITVVYDAGYCVTNQAVNVPGSTPYTQTITPASGTWAQDDGVYYASTGVKLTAVAANATPTAGQYSVIIDGFGNGSYTFAAADAAASLLVNYSYVPGPLEEACVEWVGERYRYRPRIGQTSKSLGGQETAAYSLKGMPEFIATILEPYRKSVPV